ncbi:class I poly(R)-hydroxyalkanoic acid synthase [Paracoccus sp. DK608]|uniref:Class I poly(R)-hydroxyalkanoic acid synthase n=2 Tax=Paracoccus shanxieyensis TaxID=2675752 RepID=A0A6L6IY96_9RHOB|nr:class I poly(R)-hydroxyalkanoic acid synthase [Paracoccus shanxieyensis]MTH88611.1 class I poly(R)-hydroxyalkanoic acid synthase [Paracoccus shanxieyensis]
MPKTPAEHSTASTEKQPAPPAGKAGSRRAASAKPASSETGVAAKAPAKTARAKAGSAKAGSAKASAAKSGVAKASANSGASKPERAAAKPVAGRTAKAKAASADADAALTASVAPKPADPKPAAAKAKSSKPGKASTRSASGRARTAARQDTRTVTHRRRRNSAEDQEPAVAPQIETAEGAADSGSQPRDTTSSKAFMEAAFGPQSRLPEQLAKNIERIEALTQRLVGALSLRQPKAPGVEAPGADLFTTAANAWMKLLAEQPERIMGQQVSYWGETLRHFAEAQAAASRGTLTAPPDDGPSDSRFKNPLWQSHPFFNFIKRQYQINADAMRKAASDLDIGSMTDRRRVEWFTRQMIDMMAPTNFLATNPDALEKALATEGESLVKGLENLVRDIEQHGGEMLVSLADRDAFRVGESIGTAEGRVVARTKLYELIQYSPTTDQVHEIPLVIFPPWINKFYIMDLKPQNSLIRWIVDQGYTLFVVAWKNPDTSYGQTGMEDYVSAYLEVMDRVQDTTGQEKLNVVGYCIAGTTLALTLSLLKQRGDDRVNSATFFTTLTDFSDQGEFTAFLQEDFVSGIEQEAARTGVLSAQLMTRTFSFLRANDLIWGPAIRSYMLGEPPPAFDLLFWNGDGTNLPGRMAVQYLRGLCQQNAFARQGFPLFGLTLNLQDVTVPLCAIACETDHIAPARDSWRGVAQMGSQDRTFILSESGHIAGIINPPSKKKYGHYVSDHGFAEGFRQWRDAAVRHDGSWWPRWGEWLATRSGAKVDARTPEQGFGPAPGEYVHERA